MRFHILILFYYSATKVYAGTPGNASDMTIITIAIFAIIAITKIVDYLFTIIKTRRQQKGDFDYLIDPEQELK